MSDTSAFTIGDFTFDSFHEYREGQEDLKKIEAINSRLDIRDPEVAVRLYNMIRDGEITFHTAIGDDFSAHVADIVADKSQGLLDEEEVMIRAKEQVRYQRLAGVLTAIVAVGLFGYFGFTQFREWNSARRISALRDTVAESASETEMITSDLTNSNDEAVSSDDTDAISAETKETTDVISNSEQLLNDDSVDSNSNSVAATAQAGEAEEVNPFERTFEYDPATLTVLPDYREALASNGDLVGWLKIPDTEVDYPVMQREGDNEYYLKRAFDGSDDSAGSLFMDYRCDFVNPTTNTIIYGHNMNNGTMFGGVKKYLDQEYYNGHRTIYFDSIYEKRKYEVVAVCLSEVAYQDENSYRYYNFIQAANQDQWDAFYNNVQKLSVYGTDIDLANTDQVLTISTCNNYTEDGRLFLVAKRVMQ